MGMLVEERPLRMNAGWEILQGAGLSRSVEIWKQYLR